MEGLERLAELIKNRNEIDAEIARIIGRPALPGHIGEWIASKIFKIELRQSASEKGIDGYFTEGPLKGCSVNIKFYPKRTNILDINPKYLPDYYLVLTGPQSPPASSRGTTTPLCITNVYLFKAQELINKLKELGVRIGIATSIRQCFWHEAEIYPNQNNRTILLSEEQKKLLELFSKLVCVSDP